MRHLLPLPTRRPTVPRRTGFRHLLVLVVCAGLLGAAEVPPAVVTLATAVRDLPPVTALERLDAYRGPDHALVDLLRGQTLLALDRRADAAAAFQRCLAQDPSQRAAHLGLARLAALADDWATAAKAGAAGLDLATADATAFAFLAQAGLRGGDLRLATHALQQGILRFPADDDLRRLELALLAASDQTEDLRAALRARLAKTPADADLWTHLARTADATRRPEEALAARELAWLADPTDRTRRRDLALAQAAAGHLRPALDHWRALVAAPTSPTEWEAAIRTAEQAGDLALAQAWLAQVPPPRSPTLDLLAARLALAAGDEPAARTAFDRLLAAGQADPAVAVWAGHLAERAGDPARAEACYRLAPDHGPAVLRLASLMAQQQRREEAQTLVALWLAQHPDDAAAQALSRALTP